MAVMYTLKIKMLRMIRKTLYRDNDRENGGHTLLVQGTVPFISDIAIIKFNIQSVASKSKVASLLKFLRQVLG